MSAPLPLLLLFLAAVIAGGINALAGGGSIFTFPALIALGVPPVAANVTNTVALCPGYVGGVLGQWRDLEGQRGRMLLLLPVAAVGGLAGAELLLLTSDRAFLHLVPALVLLACLLLALQEPVRRLLARRSIRIALPWAIPPVLLAAVYGGYFGAGLSVVFLAVLGLTLDDSLVRLNGLKQAMSLATNLAAAILFAATAEVVWGPAAVMAVGALIGGTAGGRLASIVKPAALRALLIVFGIGLAAIFAFRG